MTALAWGAKVSPAFRERVDQIGATLSANPACPSWLMAVMAQESGRTFDPSIRNEAGSGAVGLIQFMPQTAAALGTSTVELAGMSAERQLEFVADYFRPWTGRLHTLGDTYAVVLWPAMLGKPDSYVVFDKADVAHPKLYLQNHGLDLDRSGKITRQEVCARVTTLLQQGFRPENVWNG